MKNSNTIVMSIVVSLSAACTGGYATAPVETPSECEDAVGEYASQLGSAVSELTECQFDEVACEQTLTECESEVTTPDLVDCSSALEILERTQAEKAGALVKYEDLKKLMPLAYTDPRFGEMCGAGDLADWICEAMEGAE